MTPKFKAEVETYKIPHGTPEWYKFRTVGVPEYAGGIGASEVGKLLGLDKYRPCLPEVFAHKVGYDYPKDFENLAMQKGIALEPLIRDVWSYWVGNTETENIQALKDYNAAQSGADIQRKRTYKIYGYYLVNPKYKWLFCSLDALINAGEPNVFGEALEFDAPLEVKTISYWAAQQWETRMPPKYTAQVDQQMIVTGSEYAELVMWEDGIIRVYTFSKNANSQNMILQRSYEFWVRVMKGREMLAMLQKYSEDQNAQNQIWAEIQKLEPDPDSSEAYTEYMNERMNGVDVVKGTPTAYRAAKNYAKMRALENVVAKQKNLWKNCLLKELHKHDAYKMDFGTQGKLSKGKTFNVSIKPEPDPMQIERDFIRLIKEL